MAAKRSGSGITSGAALLFQGAIGVLGLVVILLFDIPVRYAGLSVTQSLAYGGLGALATYGLLVLVTRIPGMVPDDLQQQMRGLHRFATSFGWPVLVGLSILAGVGEELLFRGAIQGWLTGIIGEMAAIVVASVLFGGVHYISFTYFLVATGLGLILGTAYALTDSLGLVMVWHALYDIVALFCLVRFPQWFGVNPPGRS